MADHIPQGWRHCTSSPGSTAPLLRPRVIDFDLQSLQFSLSSHISPESFFLSIFVRFLSIILPRIALILQHGRGAWWLVLLLNTLLRDVKKIRARNWVYIELLTRRIRRSRRI